MMRQPLIQAIRPAPSPHVEQIIEAVGRRYAALAKRTGTAAKSASRTAPKLTTKARSSAPSKQPTKASPPPPNPRRFAHLNRAPRPPEPTPDQRAQAAADFINRSYEKARGIKGSGR